MERRSNHEAQISLRRLVLRFLIVQEESHRQEIIFGADD